MQVKDLLECLEEGDRSMIVIKEKKEEKENIISETQSNKFGIFGLPFSGIGGSGEILNPAFTPQWKQMQQLSQRQQSIDSPT